MNMFEQYISELKCYGNYGNDKIRSITYATKQVLAAKDWLKANGFPKPTADQAIALATLMTHEDALNIQRHRLEGVIKAINSIKHNGVE